MAGAQGRKEEAGWVLKIPWKRVVTALRIALNVAIDLNDAHVIKVKELEKVKTIRDVVEKDVLKTPGV